MRGATVPPLIVVLDGIEDPHNLGAIFELRMRLARRRRSCRTGASAALGGAAAKASAGAVAHVKIAQVVNIARAIDELKERRLDGRPGRRRGSVRRHRFYGAVGNRRWGRRQRIASSRARVMRFPGAIPMAGHVASLNVSVAAGIVLFEAIRQRAAAGGTARIRNRVNS